MFDCSKSVILDHPHQIRDNNRGRFGLRLGEGLSGWLELYFRVGLLLIVRHGFWLPVQIADTFYQQPISNLNIYINSVVHES
jgi:hypothetical protein